MQVRDSIWLEESEEALRQIVQRRDEECATLKRWIGNLLAGLNPSAHPTIEEQRRVLRRMCNAIDLGRVIEEGKPGKQGKH